MWRTLFLTLTALAMVVLLVGNSYLLYQKFTQKPEPKFPIPREAFRTVQQDSEWVTVSLRFQDRLTGRRVAITYTVPAGQDVEKMRENEWRAAQLLLGLPEEAPLKPTSLKQENPPPEKKDDWEMLPELKDDPRDTPGTIEWAEEQRRRTELSAGIEWYQAEGERIAKQLGRPVDLKNGRFADGSGELLPEPIRKKYMRWYVPREQLESPK